MIKSDSVEQRSAIRSTLFGPFVITFLWLLLGLATWGHLMMRPIEPNEHVYVVASVLAMEHKLYSDFAFGQMPNLPFVYAALYQLTGTAHYLFVARLATWVVTMLTCGMMGAIAYHFARSQKGLQAALAGWVLALSDSYILITGECSNYVFPILFSLVAFWALMALPIRFGSGLAGFALSLAVGFKLYYVTLVPVFAIAVFALAGHGRQRWLNLGIYLGFGVLGAFPSLLCVWRDSGAFWCNNVGLHRYSTNWYYEIHYHDRLSFFARAQYAKSCLQHPSQMWMAFGIGIVLIRWLRRDFSDWRWVSLAASLVGMSVLSALVPVPIWPQHVGMIIPFVLVMLLAAGSDRIVSVERALLVTFLVGVVVSGPYYARMVSHALHFKNWSPIAYHNQARGMVADFALNHDAMIASFMPLFIVEAGYKVEPEFAAARFIYQIAEGLSDELAAKLPTTSRSRLDAYLDSKRPELIVTPFSRSCPGDALSPDDDLDRYAETHGYEKKVLSNVECIVWRRVGQEQ